MHSNHRLHLSFLYLSISITTINPTWSFALLFLHNATETHTVTLPVTYLLPMYVSDTDSVTCLTQ